MLSVGQLTEHGYEVTFKGPTCIILNNPPNKQLIENITMTKNILCRLVLKCPS